MANSVAVSSGGKVILKTVPAILPGSNGCSKVVRCFFDPDVNFGVLVHSGKRFQDYY